MCIAKNYAWISRFLQQNKHLLIFFNEHYEYPHIKLNVSCCFFLPTRLYKVKDHVLFFVIFLAPKNSAVYLIDNDPVFVMVKIISF